MITMSLQSDGIVLNVYFVRVTGRNRIDFTLLVSERQLGSLKATDGAYATLLTDGMINVVPSVALPVAL
jgi:hypothetical protein